MILIWWVGDRVKITKLTYTIIDSFILQAWVSLHTELKTTNLKSCQQRFLSKPPSIRFANNSTYTVYGKTFEGKTFAVFTVLQIFSHELWPCRLTINVYNHITMKVFQRITIFHSKRGSFSLKSFAVYNISLFLLGMFIQTFYFPFQLNTIIFFFRGGFQLEASKEILLSALVYIMHLSYYKSTACVRFIKH